MKKRVFFLKRYRKKRKSYYYPIGILRTRIFSGEAAPQPPLGPILGQYQINMAPFCEHFNEESLAFFNERVEVRVFAKRLDFNNVLLDLQLPSISSMVFSLSPIKSRKRARLNLRRLFDLVRVYQSFRPGISLANSTRAVFSTLSTYCHLQYRI
jgi:ribosomal protein L11